MSELVVEFSTKLYKKSHSVKRKMNLKRRSIILIMFLLVACQATPSASEQLEAILRSDDECTAPCWQTIVPGQSIEEEFLDLMRISPAKQFEDINQSDLRIEGVVYSWDDDVHKSFNHIRIYGERVRLIGFQPRNRGFTLAMIENLMGPPSAYGAMQLGVEKIYIQMILIYETKGTVIEIWVPVTERDINVITSNCEFKIDLEVPLEKVWLYFVEPDLATEMVQYDPIGGFNNPNHKPQDWVDENPIKLTQCP